MGRTNRNRKRKKANDLEIEQLTNDRFDAMNSDDIYINLARSLHRNGWLNETNLKVGDFPITGRGIYSIKNFRKDDLIISLPITSLISVVSIADDMKFRCLLKRIIGTAEKQITSQSLLALYVLYLKHTKQRLEYISTIPDQFSVPFFCDDVEIMAMIPSIRNKIIDQREIINADFDCFQTHFREARCTCCDRIYFCDIFSKEQFEWSFFAVNSRSVYFNLEKISVKYIDSVRNLQKLLKDEPTLALAPFLDLLNHSCTAGTGLYIKNTDIEPLYQLYTKVPFPKYEQVFISYGTLDNVKLLTEYGFTIPNNQHDFIEIQRCDIENYFKLIPYRIRLIIINENIEQNLFINRVNGFSHNLRILIYLLCNNTTPQSKLEHDEMHLKKIIYGDIVDIDYNTDEMNTIANELIKIKITDLHDRCKFFNQRLANGTLTERANIYLNYMKDTIEWLKTVQL